MIKDAGGSAFPAANPLDTRIAPAEITLQPRLYKIGRASCRERV